MTNIVKKNYNGIDLCKYLMAYFVVAIHTNPLDGVTNELITRIYAAIVSFAVPFFFIATGFLLFIKMNGNYYDEDNMVYIKKYIKKTIQMYIIWTIIYMPLTIYGYIVNGKSILYNILEFFRGLFFIGEHFYSWPLWYLLSVIFSLCILYIFFKFHMSEKNIIIISIIFFFVGSLITHLTLITDQLSGTLLIIVELFANIFITGRLFTGLAYITIGMLIAKHNITMKKINLIMFFLGFIGNFILPAVIKEFSLLIAVSNLFLLSLSASMKDSKCFYNLRKMSTVIYLTHMIFFFLYSCIVRYVGYYGLDAFIATVLSTLLFSKIVLILENNNDIKFLKYLFG